MRNPGIPVLVIPHLMRNPGNTGRSTCKIHSLYVPFSGPRITCGLTRFSTWYPGYTRGLYPKKTAGSTVRATGEHGPCILNLPFLFPQKKREAKRKLPADVRKLKNDCEARGKRTRRARFAAAVRQAIQLQVLDRYTSAQTSFSHVRPSPPFFFPLSPIGRMASRFGHAALGCGI